MKAMYTAFAATVVISIAAYYMLGEIGFSSQDRLAGEAVRLGDTTRMTPKAPAQDRPATQAGKDDYGETLAAGLDPRGR